MTVRTRFDSALAGTRRTGTVETEFDQSAVAVPDSPGPRLVLLAPGRDLAPWGAEVSWYVPPRLGGRVEIAFGGALLMTGASSKIGGTAGFCTDGGFGIRRP
ncbi:MAG: hypothetical protein FJ087_11305 [Deltaproteobacteria bacterium]|nr:hypothetical protein [Deltaproteobacteria bacterium]